MKAGYMSGVLAMKSIAFTGGLLLFFLALYSRVKCAAIEEQTRMLAGLTKTVETYGKTIEKAFKNAEGQIRVVNAPSAAAEKSTPQNEEDNA